MNSRIDMNERSGAEYTKGVHALINNKYGIYAQLYCICEI